MDLDMVKIGINNPCTECICHDPGHFAGEVGKCLQMKFNDQSQRGKHSLKIEIKCGKTPSFHHTQIIIHSKSKN